MKYHALFVIFEKAGKFEIVVCCKLKVALYGLMGCDTRKSVFGVCDQVRLNPACSDTETSWNIEIWHVTTLIFLFLNQSICCGCSILPSQ